MGKKPMHLKQFHWSPPGIRLQLALWYTAVSAVLVLISGAAFYALLQNMMSTSFDTTLQLRAQQAAEGVSMEWGSLTVVSLPGELPELDATAAVLDKFKNGTPIQGPDTAKIGEAAGSERAKWLVLSERHLLLRILDTKEQVLYSSRAFANLSVPSDSLEKPLQGKPWWGTIEAPNGQLVRLYSTMLVDDNRIVGIVQIGQSLAEFHSTLQNILYGLIAFTLFILTLSAYMSYWLAGRAFKPIHRLTQTARQIGERGLHQRVPVPPARDEVQDLAVIFNQMIGRLERAFRQQRRFVADASHELRTPVAVIRSMTDVALSHPSNSDDYETVLREVNAESERLGRLISDLLALARADEGHVQFDREPVRLDLLAADVVDSLEPLAQERNIKLTTGRLDPATVMGDAARLIQVLISLVDNALIYNNPLGRVSVSVETCTFHVHLIVHDTGIGIGPKDRDHIFERFYRADPARSKAVGGSGLGLAIVDWIVKAHKGIVTVESQLGHGSTFMVTLPLAVSQKKTVKLEIVRPEGELVRSM